MPQRAATIESLPMAFAFVKAMQADGLEWGEGYRPLGREAIVRIIEEEMAAAVDRHLEALDRPSEADRRNGVYRRCLLTHLRQFETLTSCFTSTFPAGKATWHYITLSDCIFELGADPPLILRRDDRWRASAAAVRGREGPESVAKVCGPVRRCSDAQHVTPTESWLWIEKSNQISDHVALHFFKLSSPC